MVAGPQIANVGSRFWGGLPLLGYLRGGAHTPTGPWGYGRRIATHDEHNFDNIAYHPFFDQEAGRLVYFEGTLTASFSGAREKTPRYDYNQIMYRFALDDPRLTLPVAIYRVAEPTVANTCGSVTPWRPAGHGSKSRTSLGSHCHQLAMGAISCQSTLQKRTEPPFP